MSGWHTSDRRDRLPPDWERIRQQAGRHDAWKCQWVIFDGGRRRRCLEPGNEVDHIRPGDDHSLRNLRVLCNFHHKRKSAKEGAAAAAKKRKEISQRFRRTEEHPGLL